jgi:hypothetical protein
MKMWTVACATLLAAGSAAGADESRWKFENQETVRRAFPMSAGAPQKLLVDNINGYVHVTGGSNEVQVSVNRHTRAWSQQALEEANKEVKLDMSQQGNFVRLYVDGPFRSGNGVNYRGEDYYGYNVVFDYDIQVPAGMEVVLKTVNHGDIQLKKTTGDYEINGVNGGIELDGVAGSGTVRTVNGPVKVSFQRNPTKDCRFYTLNGKLEAYFQPPLDANAHFKTLNGSVYTDFDVTPMPLEPAKAQQSNGKFVYRSNRTMAGRMGKGGPDLSFETLNGTIQLHSNVL